VLINATTPNTHESHQQTSTPSSGTIKPKQLLRLTGEIKKMTKLFK
jgi:hypothetical protein